MRRMRTTNESDKLTAARDVTDGSVPFVPGSRGARRIQLAGLTCLVAGLLGAAGGVFLALRTPAVSEAQWGYPQGIAEFATTQVFFAASHLGLLAGLMALYWCGAVPRTRLGRAGHRVAVVGMVGLTVNELLAIIPAGDMADSPAVGAVGALYGLWTIILGLGMILEGVAAVRGGAWAGARRWLPFVAGAWLFVPTMPALALGFAAARVALTIWVLTFALLGWVLWRHTVPVVPDTSHRSAPLAPSAAR